MLRPRLIACLLVQNGGLVKTVKFGDPKYVGDPINAVRIYNEKAADELMVLDIDATRRAREPDYKMISNLATECRMPLTYGGGVHRIDQFERIVGLGVEKVAISSAAVNSLKLVEDAASRVGSQSVAVVIDIRRTGFLRRWEVVTHNGTMRTGRDPAALVRDASEAGAGEIVINNVDLDGTMLGYEQEVLLSLRQETMLPFTALGGAASLDDIRRLWRTEPSIGAAVGSLFVFKGRYRAVLINYPTTSERESMYPVSGLPVDQDNDAGSGSY